MNSNSIYRNAILNMIYRGVGVIFPLVTSIFVARKLGAYHIGQVSYAQNIASYFILFAQIGLPSYGIREIAKYRENQNILNQLFSELFILQFITTFVSSLIYVGFIASFSAIKSDYFLFICVGIQLFLNVFNIDFLFQGLEDYKYITTRSLVIKTISLFAILFLVKDRESYILYALICSLTQGANYILNIIHVRSVVHLSVNRIQLQKHIKPLLIFTFVVLMSSIYSRIDITMLGLMCSKQSVGFYTYAQKIINVILTISNAATAVFLPRLSYYYETDNTKFVELIEKGNKILFFFVLPLVVGGFILAPKIIVLLFGSEFAPASLTLRLLLPLGIIKSFGDLLCYQVIISTGNEKMNIISSTLGTVVNVTMNFWLIPLFAENGAAIASVASEFSLNIFLFHWTHKIIHYQMPKREIMQSVLGTAIMAFFVFISSSAINSLINSIIISTVLGFFVYIGFNWYCKNSVFCMIRDKITK